MDMIYPTTITIKPYRYLPLHKIVEFVENIMGQSGVVVYSLFKAIILFIM